MTDRATRLYAVVVAMLVFFVAWAAVAARPWATTATDKRLVALASREQRLRADAKLVKIVVQRRYALYRAQLARRQAQNAAVATAAQAVPAAVRVVNLPPLTITRTS